MASLKKKKTPPLALANGMWIGDVPSALKVLTLPERILIARHFPTAYIVKLYLKKKGVRVWAEKDGLHSALQGNVSTYRLNTANVASMTGERTMPPPPQILVATVGVTFVSPRNLPEKMFPGFLRVNRNRVCDALEWLKAHNPLYENIDISRDRLNDLPENGVPLEISSLARHLDDNHLLATETDGYVPDDNEETGPGAFVVKISDGKVRFSSVQRPFCPNPKLDYWFGSALSPNPELNPRFGFKGSGSGSGRGQTLNRTPNPFLGGA